MKRIATFPLVALILLGFASCDFQLDPNEIKMVVTVNQDTAETIDDAWDAYPNGINPGFTSTTYTVDELFALYSSTYLTSTMSPSEIETTQKGFSAFCTSSVADYSFPEGDQKFWVIASVTYNYKGKVLPGSLIYCTHGPDKDHMTPISPRYFVIDSHWTMTGADEFPSVGAAPVIALAHMDAVYVCPDQMAAGEAQPYLVEEETAQRTIAMAKAALGFLREQGMAPLKICEGYSIGYSQGGASALAVQREIEKDAALETAIGFHGTYSGAGPYSMTVTLDQWKEWSDGLGPKGNGPEDLAFPAAIGLIARAWDAYYGDLLGANTAESCFLSDAFVASGALADIDARSHNIGYINAKIKYAAGGKISTLLKAGWDTNASYKFMQIAQSNDLTQGWTPTHPIVFFHSTEDEVVPYANTEAAIAAFPEGLTTLHQQTGNHSEVGIKFYSWLGLQKGFPMAKPKVD